MKCLICKVKDGWCSWRLSKEDFLGLGIKNQESYNENNCFCSDCISSYESEELDDALFQHWKKQHQTMSTQQSEETVFTVKINEVLNLIEISGFGFVAELRQIKTVEGNFLYTVLIPNPPIAFNQKTFNQYLMFVDYVNFYLQAVNV